jgi:hypothetical protein
MTDRSKFEQMLEHLVNEESDKAKELFHQLVVEKSREIYETILSEDFTTEAEEDDEMEESTEEDDEAVEEAAEGEDEDLEENFGFAEGGDEEDSGDIGGDASDDFVSDIDAGGDEGDEEGSEGEGDIEDRVMDLEDALDDLRAEFEALMGDEEGGDMGGMDDMGGDDMGGDDMGGMDDMGGDDGSDDSFMREYVEKVGNPKHGDNGANAKSIVAKANNMGGTTANIVKGGESTTGGTKGGLLNPSTKEENFGNVNVPGGNAGKTAFKKKEPGHGAEKKATGDNGDRSADSPLNGAPKRAK